MLGRDYQPEKEALAAEIELADGRIRKGKLWVAAGKSLADTLNGGQPFVEFTPLGDERASHLAKAHIVAVKAIDIPKFVALHERRGVAGCDDPYQILGVSAGTPWGAVREAYLNLAKTYHPDRYSGVDLPKEVAEYLGAKARRINVAFALVEEAFKQAASPVAAG
jgi:DnaJ-domain-containing protein 1